MNAKTLTALKNSIRHWKKIVAGEGISRGTVNCALCKNFFRKNCKGCPVFIKTKQRGCAGTPWVDFLRGSRNESSFNDGMTKPFNKKTSSELRRHAQRELDFLKSLLPRKRAAK